MSAPPTRNLTRTAIAIVIAAVVVSAGLLSYSSFEATVTKTTSAGSAVDCSTIGSPAVPANSGPPLVVGNDSYQCERVLVIPPGSTGMLVVSYQADLSGGGGSEIANFTSDILTPNGPRVVEIPEQCCSYVNATGATISPSIPSVNVTALGNATEVSVTYTIKTSPGVSGFFELQYLDACPTMIPLAVGYTATQINASSFPDY